MVCLIKLYYTLKTFILKDKVSLILNLPTFTFNLFILYVCIKTKFPKQRPLKQTSFINNDMISQFPMHIYTLNINSRVVPNEYRPYARIIKSNFNTIDLTLTAHFNKQIFNDIKARRLQFKLNALLGLSDRFGVGKIVNFPRDHVSPRWWSGLSWPMGTGRESVDIR